MTRLVTCICVLILAWCIFGFSFPGLLLPQAPESDKARSGTSCTKPQNEDPNDVFTIFFTGNELGTLKPCGCSGGQLGGLDRRSAIFKKVPPPKRLIVDTGGLVKSDSEQDLIKFNIMVEALGLLDYDLVNLTGQDIEIAGSLGLLKYIGSVLKIISAYHPADVNIPASFTKKFFQREEAVAVTIAALDARSGVVEQVGPLFPFATGSDLRSVDILILNTRRAEVIDKIARLGVVDCFIVPTESDEPHIISDPNKPGSPGLVFSVGRFGRYISRLQIKTGQPGAKVKLSFSAIPLTEDLPQDESLVRLYQAYQQLIKQADLLGKQPRFVLPNGLEYTGSESCRHCHQHEYNEWRTKAHAQAYATLESAGSQFDPECVICHVVGFEYESGFVSESRTPHLKDVGCENCHGPGSEHIRTLGEVKTAEPKSTCEACHTPETSSEYLGNERFYLEKIIHWREPNATGNVKQNSG